MVCCADGRQDSEEGRERKVMTIKIKIDDYGENIPIFIH